MEPQPKPWKPTTLVKVMKPVAPAPPVYSPQQPVMRSSAQATGAPPVYRPRQTVLRTPAAPGSAPPVYRPQQTVQQSTGAPPVYRPAAVRSAGAPPAQQFLREMPQRKITSAIHDRIVQRKVPVKQAVAALNEIMKKHEEEDWYKTNWSNGNVKRIATEVAEREDTDKDNLKSRLQGHAEISPRLRAYRMVLETPDRAVKIESSDEAAVLEAVQALTFYHVSKRSEAVRTTGLDPMFGGTEGGISDERSVVGQREKNLKGSVGKVFVTRKWSEAKQYADGDSSRVIRVIIPLGVLDQNTLAVDPDSMFGLSTNVLLKAMDARSRHLDWWAASYVSSYLAQKGEFSARDNLASLYSGLVDKGAFLPPLIDPPRTLPQPITKHSGEVMSDREIELALAAKFQ